MAWFTSWAASDSWITVSFFSAFCPASVIENILTMFSAEMPDLLLCNMWLNPRKQADGSHSKVRATLGGNPSTGTHEKRERGTARLQRPPLCSLPSSSYQRSHWENWMWFVCVFLKRGAHKQPWKGPLYSARQQRCASLGQPFVFPSSQNLKHRKKRGWFPRCVQAQMMPLDWCPLWVKKASAALEVI